MTERVRGRAVNAGTRPGPAHRVVPGPGQESVWDYPRPPRVEPVPERLRVVVDGEFLAETTRGFRVLETAGAPVYSPVDTPTMLKPPSTYSVSPVTALERSEAR